MSTATATLLATLVLPLAGAYARHVTGVFSNGFLEHPFPGGEKVSRAEFGGLFPFSNYFNPVPVFNPFQRPPVPDPNVQVLLEIVGTLRETVQQLQKEQQQLLKLVLCSSQQAYNCSVALGLFPPRDFTMRPSQFPEQLHGGIFGNQQFTGFNGGMLGGPLVPGYSGGLYGGIAGFNGGLFGGSGFPGFQEGFQPGFFGGQYHQQEQQHNVADTPVKPVNTVAIAVENIPSNSPASVSSPNEQFSSSFTGSSSVVGPDGKVTTTLTSGTGDGPPEVQTFISDPNNPSAPPKRISDEEEQVDDKKEEKSA